VAIYPGTGGDRSSPASKSKLLMLNEPTIRSMLRLLQVNKRLSTQPYPNQITVFRTSEQTSIAHQDPTLGWNQLALKGVEIRPILNHPTVLRKPHVSGSC